MFVRSWRKAIQCVCIRIKNWNWGFHLCPALNSPSNAEGEASIWSGKLDPTPCASSKKQNKCAKFSYLYRRLSGLAIWEFTQNPYCPWCHPTNLLNLCHPILHTLNLFGIRWHKQSDLPRFILFYWISSSILNRDTPGTDLQDGQLDLSLASSKILKSLKNTTVDLHSASL